MTRPLCTGLIVYLLVLLTGALFGVMTAACVAVGMALLFVLFKTAKVAHRVLCVLLIALALFTVGWHQIRGIAPAQALDGAFAQVVGKVVSVSGDEESYQTVIVKIHSVKAEGVTTHPKTKLSMRLSPDDRVKAGNLVSLEATLSFSPEAANEPWLARYYRSNNILLTARKIEVLAEMPGVKPLEAFCSTWRESLSRRMETPLARALLFGDRDGLTRQQQEVFQKTGMTHMLTFSGTHFAAIAAAVTMLLGLFGLHRRQTAAALLGLTFLIMAFMGFAPSVSRAGIMLMLSYGGMLLFRQADGYTSLFVAGFLLCFTRPYVVESTGFLLTFVSVLGILLLTKPLTELFSSLLPLPDSRVWLGVCSLISVTLAASISTAPVLLATFGEFSTLAVPANLLTYFPMMALMLLGILSLLLPVPLITAVMELLEHFNFSALEWLCAFRGGMVYADSVAVLVTYVGILALIAVCFFHRKEERQHRRFALLCAVVLVVCALGTAPKTNQALTITMIDMGQGMSILVQDGGSNILIDCGSTSVNDADDRIIQALNVRNVYELDAIVITHMHRDHMSAFAPLLQRMPVKKAIVSGKNEDFENGIEVMIAASEKSLTVKVVQQAMTFAFGDSVMTVSLSPYGEKYAIATTEIGENNRSMLVRIDRGQSSLLITGDMERLEEEVLLSKQATAALLHEVDVIQVAHHGSNTSSTPAFLLQTLPAIALISVGENDYGHPSEDVLERLEALDAHIYSTKENGTIELSTTGDGVFTVHTMREGTP